MKKRLKVVCLCAFWGLLAVICITKYSNKTPQVQPVKQQVVVASPQNKAVTHRVVQPSNEIPPETEAALNAVGLTAVGGIKMAAKATPVAPVILPNK